MRVHDRGWRRERRIDRTIVFTNRLCPYRGGRRRVGIGIAVDVPQLEEVQFRSGVEVYQRVGGCRD